MFLKISDAQRARLKTQGTLVGRIMMALLFLLAGVGKINTLSGTIGYIASAGLPMPELLAMLTIAVEIIGAIMLILGWRVGYAACGLFVFTGLASWFFHNPSTWSPTDPTQQIMFMKNIALMGGLLYMMAYGPGEGWSLTKTLARRCAQKKEATTSVTTS